MREGKDWAGSKSVKYGFVEDTSADLPFQDSQLT